MNEHTIRFAAATPADIPIIHDLAQRIWRAHYPGIITIEQIDYMLDWMYSAESLSRDMREGYRFELMFPENEDVPVGFMAYCPRDGKVFLSKLYVLPERHGRGLGQQALETLKERATAMGLRTLYLVVNKRNDKAIRAYERFGMYREADVVSDIGGGFVMDDWQMRLDW
jgi:ribosomal protein S18 acetylase RimI-like enzyme